MKKCCYPLLISLVSYLLLSSGCSAGYLDSELNERAERLPHVALAPIRIDGFHDRDWSLADELGFFLETRLREKGQLRLSPSAFLRAHQRVPSPALWHSADLKPAELLLPHDFLVLVQIQEYRLQKQGGGEPIQSSKPFFYELQLYTRVIDLTGPSPRLAMQETLHLRVPVTLGQLQTDASLRDWRDKHYFRGAHAAVSAKLSSRLGRRIEERIQQAWSRRLPLSRYPQRIHSKL